MDDTPADVYRLQVHIWQDKPFEERMRLGSAVDWMGVRDAAALAKPDDPASLFLSLHGSSFEPAERARIADAIRAWSLVNS